MTTSTTSRPVEGPKLHYDLVKIARVLGYRVQMRRPRAFGPVTQCPACLSKPRRGWRCPEPNVGLSVTIHQRARGSDMWFCRCCHYGWDAAEFVAFHMFAKQHGLLTKTQKALLEPTMAIFAVQVPTVSKSLTGIEARA